MAKAKPVVVILDDDKRIAAGLAKHLESSCQVRVSLSKEAASSEKLRGAHLVVVDYDLDNWWDSSEQVGTLFGRATGVVIGLNVAEAAEKSLKGHAPFVALISGQPIILEAFSPSLCQQVELDWVFLRGRSDAVEGISEMAHWRANPGRLPSLHKFGDDSWLDFLAVPKQKDLRSRVAWSLESTERPQETNTRKAHARVVGAWLLQRLKGYPGPLWSSHYVHARLGLAGPKRQSTTVLRKLERFLDPAKYHGPLARTGGARWWKPLVEVLLEGVTGASIATPAELKSALRKHIPGARFRATREAQVVLVEPTGKPTDATAAFGEAVRVLPPGWPASADPAFMLWEDAQGDNALLAPFAKQNAL